MTTRPFPRTPNLALRRARQSMRLSQAQFADAVRAAGNAMGAPNHCTKRLVQKWESGEHAACRPDYLRILQAVTGLSARELGFRLLPDESGVSLGYDAAAGGEVYDHPGREDAVRGVGGVLARSGLTEYDADAVIEGSMDRLRYAIEHPSTVDSRTAEFAESATVRLFDLESHGPARLLTPTVDQHLSTVTSLLTAAQHEGVRRRLLVCSGRTALLAGWLAFDRGDAQSANRYWDAAIGAAEGALDTALLAASLTFHSYAAARRGDPGSDWQLAHDASLRIPDDDRATAWTTARVALYAAQFGERQAAEAAMQRSLEAGAGLLRPKPGDHTVPWMRSFDRASLLSSTAHTVAVLKGRHAGEYAVKAVDALGPAKVKARAIVLAECALAAALVDEFELCLDYGGAAATLARDLEVSVAADLLYQVVSVILPYSDTRAVRELLPQLTRLNRTADLEDEAERR